MNLFDGGFVGGCGDDSRGCSCIGVGAVEVGSEEGRPESGFDASRAGLSESYVVRGVTRLEGPGQELLA